MGRPKDSGKLWLTVSLNYGDDIDAIIDNNLLAFQTMLRCGRIELTVRHRGMGSARSRRVVNVADIRSVTVNGVLGVPLQRANAVQLQPTNDT